MTDTEQLEAWQRTTLPPMRRKSPPPLGTGVQRKDAKKIPVGALDAKSAAHGACVDHVAVPGLSEKVCILRGQDREQVIAEARQLAGVASDA